MNLWAGTFNIWNPTSNFLKYVYLPSEIVKSYLFFVPECGVSFFYSHREPRQHPLQKALHGSPRHHQVQYNPYHYTTSDEHLYTESDEHRYATEDGNILVRPAESHRMARRINIGTNNIPVINSIVSGSSIKHNDSSLSSVQNSESSHLNSEHEYDIRNFRHDYFHENNSEARNLSVEYKDNNFKRKSFMNDYYHPSFTNDEINGYVTRTTNTRVNVNMSDDAMLKVKDGISQINEDLTTEMRHGVLLNKSNYIALSKLKKEQVISNPYMSDRAFTRTSDPAPVQEGRVRTNNRMMLFDDTSWTGRIIGGRESKQGAWPWQVKGGGGNNQSRRQCWGHL